MKLRNIAAAALLLSAISASTVSVNAEAPEREHRSVWVSAYLSGGWPVSAITSTSQLASNERILRRTMETYKTQNINVLYYHVRSNCDAMYNSAYEPWSAKASGTRGVAPAFDPFELYVKIAHEYGIEVYAWVNPYRYKNLTVAAYTGENEYENAQPDWLIKNSQQYTLNPGLEVVKQRIVDVITDIVTKYDVDGVVFDDYFYPAGGTSTGTDAPDYALWQEQCKSNGMSIADWRRANVNEMVQRVNTAIKSIKPYLAFGISPACIACPPNVSTEYGLPYISGDWQYNQIYSDPLAWLKAGTIDFISPQVYYVDRFNEVDAWWANAAQKFNRHYYPSVSIEDISTVGLTAEMIREVGVARNHANKNESGIVFFANNGYNNLNEKVYDKVMSFGKNLAVEAVPSKALTPLRTWSKIETPNMVSNVANNGTTLTWTEIPGMRYVVYAHPKTAATEFAIDIEDINGVSYTNSYTLPADAANYDWYVATYDRYGNESSPLGVGATATTAQAPVLTYPANGSQPDILFEFAWNKKQLGRSIVDVAQDAAFTNLVGSVSVGADSKLSVTAFPGLEAGKTYYWRVRFLPVGATTTVSQVYSFKAPQLNVTVPADAATEVSVTPTITWTNGGAGTTFKLEVATNNAMSSPVYSVETEKNNVSIPANLLSTGRTYYVRVKATLGEQSMLSPISSFTTVNRDYAVPTFSGPITTGTLYSNQYVEVGEWSGMDCVQIQIAKSNTFPPRAGIATLNLYKGATAVDVVASGIKILSKALEDGTTYYARCKGMYYKDNKAAETGYGTVISFKYSAEAGVDDVVADGEKSAYVDATGLLHAPAGTQVNVYTISGALVSAFTTTGVAAELNVPAGVYLLALRNADGVNTIKYVK